MRLSFAVLAAVLPLVACANANSIYRNSAVPVTATAPRVVTVDAKQRHVFFGEIPAESGSTSQQQQLVLCAEAAPDVFSALSTSASGDLGLSGLGGPSQDVKARAALAIAESAGSIERTQTINLLRESMYRTCERYLNGGIGRDELVVQAARDQRAMVAVLAIEQLTRSVWPNATVLNAGAANATLSDVDAYAAQLKKAAYDAADKDAAKDKAATAYDAATCAPILAAPAPPAGDAKLSAYTTCKNTHDALDSATATANQADTYLGALKTSTAAAANGSQGAAAGAGASSSQVAVTVDKPDMSQVAGAVKDIVQMSYDFDEGEMVCVVKLRNDRFGKQDDALRSACVDLLKKKIELSTQLYNTQLLQLGAAQVAPAIKRAQADRNAVLACWAANKTAFVAAATAAFAKQPDPSNLLPLVKGADAAALARGMDLGGPSAAVIAAVTPGVCPT